MESFIRHQGIVLPLDRPNIDTDIIIPKQFLKRMERKGLGECLFYDWRYDNNKELNKNFIMNQSNYKNSTILLTRENFGCGSSREHAVWSIKDYGFKAIIAPSYAEIFYTNCFKNGILPIVLNENDIDQLFHNTAVHKKYSLFVDLENKLIKDNFQFEKEFGIEEFLRERLLKGLDDIALTLKISDVVQKFETNRKKWLNPTV